MPVLPIGFAHRGARSVAPDNTLRSFTMALQLGASGLETDAWTTLDGSVVLDHDGLAGPPWRRKPIAQLSQASLPAHIPTLTELYKGCGADFELSVDVKDPGAFGAVIEAAQAAGAATRMWICHPDASLLAAVRQSHRSVHLVHSTSLRQLAGVGPAPTTPAGRFAAAAVADRQVGIDAINLRAEQWSDSLVAACHDAGLLAFGWDAQRRSTLDGLLQAGIDGVYSDHVGPMVEAIARLKQRNGG